MKPLLEARVTFYARSRGQKYAMCGGSRKAGCLATPGLRVESGDRDLYGWQLPWILPWERQGGRDRGNGSWFGGSVAIQDEF